MVAVAEVYCGCLRGWYRVLGVDQEYRGCAGIMRPAEITVGFISAPRWDDAGLGPFAEQLAKENAKRLSTCYLRAAIAAALDEYMRAHQRVPPSCPLVQSSPSV